MEAGKAQINTVFNSSRLLEIPFYQRAYVWGEEQWERFLNDMEYVSATNRPYFLGSIILKQTASGNTWDEIPTPARLSTDSNVSLRPSFSSRLCV